MSVSPIITGGFGNFGSVNFIPMLGFGTGSVPVVAQAPQEIGWTSSARLFRMSEEDFEKLRKKSVWADIRKAENQILALKNKKEASQDKAHKAVLVAPVKKAKGYDLDKILAREAKYQAELDVKIQAIMARVLARWLELEEEEEEDEETILLNSFF